MRAADFGLSMRTRFTRANPENSFKKRKAAHQHGNVSVAAARFSRSPFKPIRAQVSTKALFHSSTNRSKNPHFKRGKQKFPLFSCLSFVTLRAIIKRVSLSSTNDVQAWNWAHAGFSRALDALFPPRCGGCRAFEADAFCPDCVARLRPLQAPFCTMCGRPFDPLAKTGEFCALCRQHPRHFAAARSAFLFLDPLRTAIHRFKYFGYHSYAAKLAPLLLQKWDADPILAEFTPDFLAPVPLHRARLRARGFNQSVLLAREMARAREIPVLELQRTRDTVSQVGLDAPERAKNVSGAFAVEAENIGNARVLLVDDVFTTGATLDECARALKKAGASEVCALTLARQGHPDEELLVPPQRADWSLF
jgi:ComF family protein